MSSDLIMVPTPPHSPSAVRVMAYLAVRLPNRNQSVKTKSLCPKRFLPHSDKLDDAVEADRVEHPRHRQFDHRPVGRLLGHPVDDLEVAVDPLRRQPLDRRFLAADR